MGFENRDYYREDDGMGFTLGAGGLGTACKTLIAINVVVLILQIFSAHGPQPSAVSAMLRFHSGLLLHGQIWRIFTWGFGFLDGNILGFLFDMLFIWWFGKSMETMYGTRELLLFYGAAILIGSTACLAAHFATGADVWVMGSAAPAMAITVLFAWHFPYRQILLFFIIPVPIFAVVAFYVVISLLGVSRSGFTAGPVIAGLSAVAFGLLYGWSDWRIESLLPGQGQGFKIRFRERKPKLRVYDPKPTEEADREVDRILEKIHNEGEGSLTDKERKTLQKASRRYRK